MIGLCPFHDEKTPSFTVSPAKNLFKCFGCGKGGDPVRFIMEHEKLSFPESIRFLAEKYKIEIEETVSTQEEIQSKQTTDSYYIVNQFARDYYVDSLFNRSEGKAIGLSYFKERGLREVTINKFQLGYAVEERDNFTKIAIDKKYNIEHLRTVGLTTASDNDFFRARVIFPIHNVSGKVIGFAGRTLSADKKMPKYINSPESEIYNKRNVLYGMYFAKESIRKEDECILVEGYTDVISLHQGEITHVVATSGTALTKEQIRLIKRYTPNIKLIYDGDTAGVKAALRGLDLVLESDMNVKLVLLPDGHDPDSYLHKVGPEGFRQFLKENEEDFVLFKSKLLMKEVGNDPIKKTGVIRDIVSSIAKIPDTFKRLIYVRHCSSILDISEDILTAEVNKTIKAELQYKKTQPNQPTPQEENEWISALPKSPIEQPQQWNRNDAGQEKSVCEVLVNYGHQWYDEDTNTTIAKFIIDNSIELIQYFDVPLYKRLLELVQSELEKGQIPNAQWYIGHPEEEIRNFATDAMTSPYVYASWDQKEIFLQTQKMPEENYIRDAEYAISRLQFKKYKHIITELESYFTAADENEKNSQEYVQNIKVLQIVLAQRNDLLAKLGGVVSQI